MADSAEDDRWRKTRALAVVTLAGATIAAITIAALSVAASGEVGFPLAHVLLTALLPIGLAAAIFWFGDRQSAIDRQFGHYEE